MQPASRARSGIDSRTARRARASVPARRRDRAPALRNVDRSGPAEPRAHDQPRVRVNGRELRGSRMACVGGWSRTRPRGAASRRFAAARWRRRSAARAVERDDREGVPRAASRPSRGGSDRRAHARHPRHVRSHRATRAGASVAPAGVDGMTTLTVAEVCRLLNMSERQLQRIAVDHSPDDPPPRFDVGTGTRPSWRWDGDRLFPWLERRSAWRSARGTAADASSGGDDSTARRRCEPYRTRKPASDSSSRSNGALPSEETGSLRVLAGRLAPRK